MSSDMQKRLAQLEAELASAKKENARLTAVLEMARVGGWQFFPMLGRASWTALTYEILGIEEDREASPETLMSVIHPDDRERCREALVKAMAGEAPYNVTYRVHLPDGSERTVHSHGVLLRDDDGRPRLSGVVQDVTEVERLRLQLLQAQKMETVGRLAGGLAHDFNNLLTVIHSSAELLRADVGQQEPARTDIADLQEAAKRATSLTRQLLTFSRRSVLAAQVVEVNDLLSQFHRILRRVISEQISIEMRLEPDAGHLSVDPQQMTQVLMNLAINARDAMPDGGKLTVATSKRVIDDGEPSDQVCIEVTDTGFGMSEEVRQRIFEPFFTTKDSNQGTGLGLSMAHGIVTQSGGRIEVESEPGKGTRFRLYFPCAAHPQPTEQDDEPISMHIENGESSATILLVEDDAAVRRMAARILEGCGYRVLQAANGLEAIALSREDIALDLLITDVVMPLISGRAVADELLKEQPDMPVIFMSGYTGDVILDDPLKEHGVYFLAKPFQPKELLAVVRKALGAVAK
jgi:two-component system cell cycle sensor histidine kinase/response regulator CckA